MSHRDSDESSILGSESQRTYGSTSASTEPLLEPIFRVSKKRWLVLTAMVMLAFFGNLCDQSSPILDIWLSLLELDIKTVGNTAQFISIMGVFFTMPIAWLVDKKGISFGLYACMIMTVLRNVFRGLAMTPTLPYWQHLKFYYWLILQIFGTFCSICFWCLPMKISELWFPESERSIAWVLPVISCDIGGAIASYFLPIYVVNLSTTYLYGMLNFAVASLLILVIPICVTQPVPEYPPSQRALQSTNNKVEYFTALKRAARSRDYCLHLFFTSVHGSIALAFYPYIEDILQTVGYDNQFCGRLLSSTQILSVIFILISSKFVANIGNITLACKLFAFFTLVALIGNLYTLTLPNSPWLIYGGYLFYCAMSKMGAPNYQNMTAQLGSGLLSEATNVALSINGIMVVCNLMGFIFLQLRKVGPGNRVDYTDSFVFIAIALGVPTLMYLICFRGKTPKLMQSVEQIEEEYDDDDDDDDDDNQNSRGGSVNIDRHDHIANATICIPAATA